MSSIRTLYDQYGEVSHNQADTLKDDALMSIGEWMTFCTHLGLIESRQLTIMQVSGECSLRSQRSATPCINRSCRVSLIYAPSQNAVSIHPPRQSTSSSGRASDR